MSRYHDQFSKTPKPVTRYVVTAKKRGDEREGVVKTRAEADTLAAKWHRRGWRVSITVLVMDADTFDSGLMVTCAYPVPWDELPQDEPQQPVEPKTAINPPAKKQEDDDPPPGAVPVDLRDGEK